MQNKILIKTSDEVREKIDISIGGNNNTVIIEELVEVEKRLEINITDNNSYIYIGRGTTFEEAVISVADENNQVLIGEDCMFSSGCKILASDFHSIIDLKTGIRKNIPRGVKTNNHVWVGMGALILKNTDIGDNSIIGANTTVAGKIPGNSIYRDGKIQGGVTWERQRLPYFSPMPDLYERKEVEAGFSNITAEVNIVFHIENDIKRSLNKIKGWAFMEERKSEESKVYLRFFFGRKALGVQVMPLIVKEREDVAEAFGNADYLNCGFDSYMPGEIIDHQKDIEKVELLIDNKGSWGIGVVFENIKG